MTQLTKKFPRSFGLAYRKANDYEIYEIYDFPLSLSKPHWTYKNFYSPANVSKNMYSTRIPPLLALAMSHGYRNNPGLGQPG